MLPPLHSGLCLANHILYEPSRAIRPRAPRSFWRAGILKMLQRVSSTTELRALRTPGAAPNLEREIDGVEALFPEVACQSLVPGQLSLIGRLEVVGGVPWHRQLQEHHLGREHGPVDDDEIRLLLSEHQVRRDCAAVGSPAVEVGVAGHPLLLALHDGVQQVGQHRVVAERIAVKGFFL